MNRLHILVFVGWLIFALPLTASADQVVGRVISKVGEVVAVRPDDTEHALSRGDEIHVGDTLITGERGRVQIRFIDEGLVDLRPESRFEVEQYQEGDDEESGSAVMNFLQGAMRAVSGRIGDEPDDEYRMESPVATVGIRGTDYSLQFCDADCADVGRDEGLYGRVDEGGVVVSNPGGTGEFGEGDYFYVADENSAPQQWIAPPEGILDGNDDGDTEEEEEQDEEAEDPDTAAVREEDDDDTGAELEIITDDDDDDLVTTDFVAGDDNPEADRVADEGDYRRGMVGGFQGAVLPFGGSIVDAEHQEFITEDDLNRVIAATFDDGDAVTNVGSAALTETGNWTSANAETVYWGVWDGSDFDLLLSGDGLTVGGEFAFMYSNYVTGVDTLGTLTGSAEYQVVGGPGLISANNDWSLDHMQIDINFEDVTANMFLLATTDDSVFGYGGVHVDASAFDVDAGSLEDITFDISGNWQDDDYDGPVDGSVEGLFVGSSADGLMIYLEVELSEGGGAADMIERINGVKFLEK